MKRSRPRQHVRRMSNGKKVLVNKGVRKKAKRNFRVHNPAKWVDEFGNINKKMIAEEVEDDHFMEDYDKDHVMYDFDKYGLYWNPFKSILRAKELREEQRMSENMKRMFK